MNHSKILKSIPMLSKHVKALLELSMIKLMRVLINNDVSDKNSVQFVLATTFKNDSLIDLDNTKNQFSKDTVYKLKSCVGNETLNEEIENIISDLEYGYLKASDRGNLFTFFSFYFLVAI